MKKRNNIKVSSKGDIKFRIIIALSICIFSLSIGYAAVNSSVNVTGEASALSYGELYIEILKTTSSKAVTNQTMPNYNMTTLKNSLNFANDSGAYITYQITITNATTNIRKYTGENYNVSIDMSNTISYEIKNFKSGKILMPGESVTFDLTYKYRGAPVPNTYNLEMVFNFEDLGKLYAINNTKSVDLTTNPLVPLNIKIINDYSNSINYSLTLDNNKFELVDQNGNPLNGLYIQQNKVETKTVYIKQKSDVVFYNDHYTTKIYLNSEGKKIDLGVINITNNITPGASDTIPPQIGPVLINMRKSPGIIDINWSRIDSDGSDVLNYYIKLYNTAGELVKETSVDGNTLTCNFTNIEDNVYYAVVYGEDEAGNTGENVSATTSTTDSRRSDNTEIKWKRSVTYNLVGVTHKGPDTVYYGQRLEFTLTLKLGYKYTKEPEITSNGRVLKKDTDYTQNTITGDVVIDDVRGDIVVTAEASDESCLAEGTQILMADGSYKAIENIGYDDLILVYDHEFGNFVPEYPIWIEQKDVSEVYQIITFSDNTILKTISTHAVFSTDDNRYVDVLNRNEFNIGTKVKKVRKKDGKYEFYDVSVKNIEKVYGKINYYDVVTTRFYNLISNDILTSDGRTALSNYYEFKENLLWSDRRQYAVKNNIAMDYKDFKGVPYYLFHGLKAQDGAVIIKYNYMTEQEFKNVFNKLLLNRGMILPPNRDNKNNRIWMVTTSDDIITPKNKKNYLYKENSEYVLKEPKNKDNFIDWYCTSDGKFYKPHDKVTIYHGTHFVARYKQK